VACVLTACTATPQAAPPPSATQAGPKPTTQAAPQPTAQTAAPTPTAQAAPQTSAQSSDAILRVGISAPLNSLKPVGLQQTSMTYNRAIYDSLVNVGPHGTLLPHLATSWDVSPDGMTLTLHLRTGVTFQNGTAFNADSAVAMLKWVQDPANAMDATTVLKGMTVSASDPTTVVIKMTRPAAAELLPTLVTLPIADLSSDLPKQPIGTGPFKVTSFTPNVSLTVTRNNDYWDKAALPRIGGIKYTVFENAASEVAAFESRAIDILTYPPLNQVARLKDNGAGVVSSPGTGNFYFFGNVTTSTPWANQKVRQALSYAFDRPTFVRLQLGGLGVPTCSMWAASSASFVQDLPGCGYDLAKAKQLLVDAGYADGFTITFYTTDVRIPEITSFLPVYQNALKTIGVTLDIQTISPNDWANNFTEISQNGKVGVQDNFYGWANADAFFANDYPVYGRPNLSKFSSPEYDGLIQKALDQWQTPDQQTATFKQLDIMANEQSFAIVLATRPYVYLVNKNVSGVVVDDDGQADWSNVTVAAQ
jgi:peptide/nickel transport system substrate-binding protein